MIETLATLAAFIILMIVFVIFSNAIIALLPFGDHMIEKDWTEKQVLEIEQEALDDYNRYIEDMYKQHTESENDRKHD